jgi:hypothetical protein
MLGRANWWAPAPVARLHDRYGIDTTVPHSGKPLGHGVSGA